MFYITSFLPTLLLQCTMCFYSESTVGLHSFHYQNVTQNAKRNNKPYRLKQLRYWGHKNKILYFFGLLRGTSFNACLISLYSIFLCAGGFFNRGFTVNIQTSLMKISIQLKSSLVKALLLFWNHVAQTTGTVPALGCSFRHSPTPSALCPSCSVALPHCHTTQLS